jgi:hypothetical protein
MKILETYSIPTYSEKYPRWKMSVDLSGVRYQLYVTWNTRMENWYMTILDIHDKILLGGLRLVPNILLLEKYRASVLALPPGDLVIFDREGKMETAELTRDNLGSRFELSYVISGE